MTTIKEWTPKEMFCGNKVKKYLWEILEAAEPQNFKTEMLIKQGYTLPCLCARAKLLQSCLTLCDPVSCSLLGSSVHGILLQEYWSGLPCPPPGSTVFVVVVKVTQSCLTLFNPKDYTVHGILQGRILEWVGSLSLPRGSSQLRDQTQGSRIAGGFFTSWATREDQEYWSG